MKCQQASLEILQSYVFIPVSFVGEKLISLTCPTDLKDKPNCEIVFQHCISSKQKIEFLKFGSCYFCMYACSQIIFERQSVQTFTIFTLHDKAVLLDFVCSTQKFRNQYSVSSISLIDLKTNNSCNCHIQI